MTVRQLVVSSARLTILAGGLLGLAACGAGGQKADLATPADSTALPVGQENHLRGETTTASDKATAGVNAYLWRGAIDTLSFMPFASAEPAGGTIITDWYSPPTVHGERFKINAYILGRDLRSDAVHVAVFRQVMQDGQWVDTPSAPNTAADITNKILARARQLRTMAGGGNG